MLQYLAILQRKEGRNQKKNEQEANTENLPKLLLQGKQKKW